MANQYRQMQIRWNGVLREKRDIEYFRRGVSEHGRSTGYIRCPFCGCEVMVYLWSFAGCGKRCGCGVLLVHGFAVKDREGMKIEDKD